MHQYLFEAGGNFLKLKNLLCFFREFTNKEVAMYNVLNKVDPLFIPNLSTKVCHLIYNRLVHKTKLLFEIYMKMFILESKNSFTHEKCLFTLNMYKP